MNRTPNSRLAKRLNSVFSYTGLFIILSLVGPACPLAAAIVQTGNVEPAGTWINSTTGYIGKTADGALAVDGGSLLRSSIAYIAYNVGVSGTATVAGDGSNWINGSSLMIGYYGSGTLTIKDAGKVGDSWGFLGREAGSTGTATVTGAGSTWTSSSSLNIGWSGIGMLTIEAGGQVGNAANGFLGYNAGSSGVAIVTGTGSTWTNDDGLVVGSHGSGTLAVKACGLVTSDSGLVGYDYGSAGSATIAGSGSAWTIRGDLNLGDMGSGLLTIEAGGQVSNYTGFIGVGPTSSGKALVVGAGATWINRSALYVGRSGPGTLHIRDAGNVTTGYVSVNSSSLLTLDVGRGSLLSVGEGAGAMSNGGIVRILAGPQPAAGSLFSPIVAGSWSGSGTYQDVGGTWNATSHLFTVSQTLAGVSGSPIAINLAQRQRVLVEEIARDWTLGASFLAKTGTGKTVDFSATAITDADLTSLQGLLQPGHSVMGAWDLAAAGTGYVATDPIYLSLSVPPSLSRSDLKLWKLSGGSWSPFTADDLTTTASYASFTITGVSGYAVTAVPEPASVVLLGILASGLLITRLRRQKLRLQ